MSPEESKQLAETIRAACVEAAQTAGTMAMFDGLCAEGIVEVICDAIRRVDVEALRNTGTA